MTQQKRAAGDVSDGEVQRHKHRSETHSGLKRAREEDKNESARRKTSSTKAATGTSEQEPD